MARRTWVRLLWVPLLFAGYFGNIAAADPPLLLTDYHFIAPRSLVDVRSSSGSDEMQLNILGRFGLVRGWNEEVDPTTSLPQLVPFAQFTNVQAILYDPRRATPLPTPGWDLDKTLNLSGLHGTFTLPDDLFFLGSDGQGQAFRLEAKITGPLVHLTGGSSDPCCHYDLYSVDAWAHQLPWADFDGNGQVAADDYVMWRYNFGTAVAPGSDGDANGDGVVDGIDYTVWRHQLGQTDGTGSFSSGQVPEPATIRLLFTVLLAPIAQYVRSQRNS